jgi:CheY-like chemotaxis protein
MQPEQTRILIVEDEPKIAALLEDYLRAHGDFQCSSVHRGDQALDRWTGSRYASACVRRATFPSSW